MYIVYVYIYVYKFIYMYVCIYLYAFINFSLHSMVYTIQCNPVAFVMLQDVLRYKVTSVQIEVLLGPIVALLH